jgi:CheY-like chemotaxis protein
MLGHEVELVENGQMAIAAYQEATQQGRPFDAAFLDLTIRDGMGGKETIEILRKIDPRVKAIIMSGYSADPVITRYKDYGFTGVLDKPFDIQQVQKVLCDMLSGTSRHISGQT